MLLPSVAVHGTFDAQQVMSLEARREGDREGREASREEGREGGREREREREREIAVPSYGWCLCMHQTRNIAKRWLYLM